MSDMTEGGPVVKVARDLREIENMCSQLDDQAEHKANTTIDGHHLPGGLAMVALAPVANLEAWHNRLGAAERAGRDVTAILEDEDETWEPPLQTLLFWSEDWRRVHDSEWGVQPTVATEVAFLRWALHWAWDNEPRFGDFASDIHDARVRIENVLYAGERPERGVPCMYDECKGSRIIRKHEPYRDEGGRKAWRWSAWFCVKCKRTWTEDRYASMITAAHEATKFEDIDGDVWCSVDYAARTTGRSESTIRQWIHKGHLATVCIISGRRVRFVRLSDVLKRHEAAGRRRTGAA